jgi:uncharacterized membrane protein YedE/YeeE
MPIVFALLAGILFGAGLTLSDMVNQARVLDFLDVAGTWDPTLMFVMAGGLAVTTAGYKLIFRRGSPFFADRFNLPIQRRIDLPLVGGAALFGVGWGLAGICPGPALTDLATLEPKVLLFVATMLLGMIVASAWRDRLSAMKALPRPREQNSSLVEPGHRS